ncbi:MAG: FAD-binding protein [Actinomycetota bacterium]|nr:FAD-binding protein [Actinomycetota bacterium]
MGHQTSVTTGSTWHNWAGNQVARPDRVLAPRDIGELADLVRAADGEGSRVKAIGSGHSFTAIGVTDGIQVRLGRLADLLSADRSTGLVTVEAGMPLHRLNGELAERGLALRNLGDIDRQTVAGAISTGTHGTGQRLGGLAAQVRALQIVLADGSVVTCSATEHPELFSAARVGLGALGILATVTLQAEPAFALRAQERPMSLPSVLGDLDALVADNDHFEFFWFPHTDTTLTKCNNRLPARTPLQPLGRRQSFVQDELFSNGVFGLACGLGRLRPALIPRINAATAGSLGHRTYADASYKVFVSTRRVRFVEMEYGVPAEAVRAAIEGIRRVIDMHDLRVSFPVEVRFTAADDIPLSTASGRASAYLAVHMYKGQPYDTYFRAVEAVMRDLDGRPHWGKVHYQDADSLAARYPRFHEFLAVRDTVDPRGRFANAYLDRVLGAVT